MSDKKGYGEKDAARDTGASTSKAAEMHHQAREDARASGELHDRAATSASSRASNEPSNPDPNLVGDKTVEQQQLRADLQNIRDTVDTSKK